MIAKRKAIGKIESEEKRRKRRLSQIKIQKSWNESAAIVEAENEIKYYTKEELEPQKGDLPF